MGIGQRKAGRMGDADMRVIAAALGLALCVAAAPAWAEEDPEARAARWTDLKHAVFGEREVTDGAGVITLEAPARAQDAALVPITVSLSAGGGAGPGRGDLPPWDNLGFHGLP